MYTTSKQMLMEAQKGGYAVGAFNIENMEMMQAVIEAAEELQAPVIIQTTPGTLKYAGPELFSAMVRVLAEGAKVPVALHLDHGSSFELAERSLLAGYSSLMIDGSALPLDENMALARRVVAISAPKGISVEAELGVIGGKEDDLSAERDVSTDPAEAELFAKETQVDSLAIAIGTAHGFYKSAPKLNKDRLKAIRERVEIPLVLHGASGIDAKDVQDVIRLGICKVNFATELRAAYVEGVKQALAEDPSLYDPKKLGAKAKACVKELTQNKIRLCGAEGRA